MKTHAIRITKDAEDTGMPYLANSAKDIFTPEFDADWTTIMFARLPMIRKFPAKVLDNAIIAELR